MAILASLFALQFAWAQPGNYDVEAGAFYFSPQTNEVNEDGILEIEVGSTVTWINVGGFHDVNFETNSITGESFGNPEAFSLSAVYSAGPDSPVEIGSYTFTIEGTYNYDCAVGTHAAQGMIGTIIVTPEGEYPGCTDELACNYDEIANIDDGSCLYNDLCCEALTPDCLACQACQTPEEWCLDNPGYAGCDAYDVVGCMDDGLQEWSPFPGIAADDYEPGANTPGDCAYWGCGNPDNTLMLVGTFMDLNATQNEDGTWSSNGWDGSSMTVFNIWEDSYIYDVMDTVFYFSPTPEIMYELPPLPTEDVAGAIDLTGSPNEEDADYNPNYGADIPDGQINHDDCLECPLNEDFVGNYGYVVNFCAPDDLLDGCYQLVVDEGDASSIAWQIQNAEISVFALTGSTPFDSTSGSACTEDTTDAGFDFYDIAIESVSFDQETGILSTQVCNSGNETTADQDGNETFGTTWVLIDGFAEISDSPEELTAYNSIVDDFVTSEGYFWGTCYDLEYDLSELTSASVLGPGSHSITVWVNGGAEQPLGVSPEFSETFYENNYMTIQFDIPFEYGCMDPWASNYNPNANSDDDGNEPCYYICGDTDGDGEIDNDSYQSFTITCGGGSWQGEVGWTIQTVDGFEVISGGAPFDSNDYTEYGICLAPGCYQVLMTDTYGDGWNGNELEIGDDLEFTIDGFNSEASALFEVGENGCGDYLGCMDTAATNYSENAIQDDGSCEYDCSSFTDDNGIPFESVEINVNGGSFQAEVGWEIVDADGTILMSDGAPYSDVACLSVGCYTLNMSDSFGDGWNGNVMTLETGSGFTWTFEGPTDPYPNGTSATGTFATGDPTACGIYFGCMDSEADNYDEINNVEDGSCEYSCPDGGTAVTIECDGGTYQYEVSWTIYDSNGAVVVSGGAPYYDEGTCLADGCYTIEMTDSYGDGWNGNDLTIVGEGIDFEVTAEGTGGSAAFGVNDDSCVTEGCMDDTAENYNPDANMDDGSCEYDCATWLDTEELYSCYWYVWVYNTYEYTVEMMEGYGYDCTCVENPVPGCTDPNADNYDTVATENDGSCVYTCDEDAGQVSTTITCDGGTWQGEVSWQIYDSANNLVASGGAPYSNEICLLDDECYSVEMQDSYGDGWNGNILNIGGVEMSLYAGTDGNGTYNCVYECDFDEVAVSVNNGSGTSFGFSITNSAGDVVLGGGSDFEGVVCIDPDDCYDVNLASSGGMGDEGASLIIGDNEYSWTGFSFWYAYHYEVIGGGCPVYGCMDETADNYNPDADVNEVSPADASDPCIYYGCTDPNASNYDAGANSDDASCEYICEDGLDAYLVSCDGGSFQYEVTWEVVDGNGNITATGGAPTSTGICLAPGCYTVNMYDSWGDGWNGNILTIGDMSFELEEGSFAEGVLVAGVEASECGVFYGCTDPEAANYDALNTNDDGSCIYECEQEGWESVTVVCDGGLYQYEVAFNIEDADGNIIFSAGDVDYAAGGGYDFANPGIVDTWTCLDPNGCYTINMADAYGDGWNGNILTIGGDTEITLFAGTTGSAEYGYCPFECDLPDVLDIVVNNGEGTDFGFIITDYDGNTVASGGNDYNSAANENQNPGCFDLANGCYTISLSSAVGGGNGSASLSIGDDEFEWNDGTGGYWSSIIVEGLGTGCPTLGCTDDLACNFNSEANLDDGSCWYAEDCDNYCVNEEFDYADGTAISTTSLFDTWFDDGSADVYVSGGEISVTPGSDIVTTAPVFENGSYTVSFDMGIPSGGSGYFNMGNSGDPNNWQWEFEVYFNSDGTGYTTQSYELFNYESGVIAVEVNIDLDAGLASVSIDGSCVETWDWTGNLGGVNFFGATADTYTVDNFSLCAGDASFAICVPGCTDSSAFNYNPDATEDDGSCIAVIEGCTDPAAWNYNILANTDDGSCVNSCADIGQAEMTVTMFTNGVVAGWYGSSITIGDDVFTLGNVYQDTQVFCADLTGCLDVTAGGGIQQYNIGWTINADGEDILTGGAPFTGEIGDCNIPGCTDETACNYNSAATEDDGSCTYSSECVDCNGIAYDDDNDGVGNCDEVAGCTDPTAANYDSSATDEDGSCNYAVYGCTNSAASNFDSDANTDDGSCDFGPWGEVPSTDCNMTVLLQGGVTTITVEGEVATNIWIGVTNSVGDVVGSVLWTDETTSIAVWGAEGDTPGMEAGEEMNWIVSTDGGDIIGSATFSFGSGEWACNG
ncbi:MAG: hypothetical protein CMD23_02465, partial [Flavobacteriales bacterium]|nr:hypothetical protein [Flavobacteriales bacterium]